MNRMRIQQHLKLSLVVSVHSLKQILNRAACLEIAFPSFIKSEDLIYNQKEQDHFLCHPYLKATYCHGNTTI